MFRYNWLPYELNSDEALQLLHVMLQQYRPTLIALDTETTGLHIIMDKPFVIQLGFTVGEQGFSFVAEKQLFPQLQKLLTDYMLSNPMTLIGHNLKYDLHMLENIGWNITEIAESNPRLRFSDTQFYIRYGHDALRVDEGGPPMGLKDYAARYIDSKAKLLNKELDREKAAIAKHYNVLLRQAMGVSQKDMDAQWFKDCTFEPSDLPSDLYESYNTWLDSLPLALVHKVQTNVVGDMIPYDMLDRPTLLRYAHMDIWLTLEVQASLRHVIEGRQQEIAMALEEDLIMPLFRMERTGFLADKEYLESCRIRLKEIILQKRQQLHDSAGRRLNISQHAVIKQIVADKFGIQLETSGKEALELMKEEHFENKEFVEFINLIQELRTLEKWYSAYILRFQVDLKRCDRLYTQINQVGTVSGRVTSDFQQFPKQAITVDGVEIFHPRRIVKTEASIFYLDYSQIELRVQALYTILVGDGDLNLCRAYFPYKCIARNYHWYLEEQPDKEWTPVDVHSETTKAATGLDESDPEFKYLRASVGKRVNFSKNYGAELARIKQMFPHKSDSECRKINDSYYKAFPGVRKYHAYCNTRASQFSNTESLFGIRYYNVSGHKLKNLLIQGSSAHLLKYKIIAIDEYIKGKEDHIRMQMQIHDELSFEVYDKEGERMIVFIRGIMEAWDDSIVPIVAEIEHTTTTWAEKGPWKWQTTY